MEKTYTSRTHCFIDDQLLLDSYVDYEARQRMETERKMDKSEHSAQFGSRALFTFVQPTEKKKITYREQQSRLRGAMARHALLQDGSLLDTLEKGVAYPVIHVNWRPRRSRKSTLPPIAGAGGMRLSPKDNGGGGARRKVKSPCSADENEEEEDDDEDLLDLKLLREDALGPSIHVQQGLYEEVKRIEPDGAFSPRDNNDQRAFIILGFKTLDNGFSSVLESTWRDWTGARAIYLRLHNDYDLAKIIFYHRVTPANNLDLFMYLVVVECWNVTNRNLIRLLDFVQRMRVERLNGYISLYRDFSNEEDEADSNYHSGSQESLVSSCAAAGSGSNHSYRGSSSVARVEEEDEGVFVTEKASSVDMRTRVVETLTIERQPSIKFQAID